jgi:acetyl esterase/lipase
MLSNEPFGTIRSLETRRIDPDLDHLDAGDQPRWTNGTVSFAVVKRRLSCPGAKRRVTDFLSCVMFRGDGDPLRSERNTFCDTLRVRGKPVDIGAVSVL